MGESARYRALEQAGLLHPGAEGVRAEPFRAHPEFFASFDKVQVKYEMLRCHVVEGHTVTAAASAHGYSRAEFYLVAAAFDEAGMTGLLDERRGRKGPTKLTGEVRAFLDGLDDCSASEAAAQLEASLGVRLHPRSIQRARRR